MPVHARLRRLCRQASIVLMMMACQVWSSWSCAFAVPCRSSHLSPARVRVVCLSISTPRHTPRIENSVQHCMSSAAVRAVAEVRDGLVNKCLKPARVLARRLQDAGGPYDTRRGGRGSRAWQRTGMRARVICWSGSGQKDRRGVHGAARPTTHALRARRLARAKVSDSRR